MVNAKAELLNFLKNKPEVRCALVSFDKGEEPNTDIGEFILKDNYSEAEWEEFLNFLDFEYNDWNGVQQLFGIIWTKIPGWIDRSSYHGKEWWEYHKTPVISPLCLNETV